MHRNVSSAAICLALLCLVPGSARAGDSSSPPCFDHSRSDQLRLWEGRAPGAIGDDPCRDIPFMRVFGPPTGTKGPVPALVIIPGGGYHHLSNRKEQDPVAEHFSKNMGVKAFVLYYRLVQEDGTYRYPVPMWDGQRAVKLLRSKARELGIDGKHIAVLGFSAGGHLASTLALHAANDFGLPEKDAVDQEPGHIDLLGLGYPVISMDPQQDAAATSRAYLLRGYRGHELSQLQQELSGQYHVTPHTPPVFLFTSRDDARVRPENSLLFDEALRAAGRPVEFHLYRHGEHGAGLATNLLEESSWPGFFQHWLRGQHFFTRDSPAP